MNLKTDIKINSTKTLEAQLTIVIKGLFPSGVMLSLFSSQFNLQKSKDLILI